ncbi:hypothetical protein Ddye_030303 [Dipteronia dyeriana]|uniref:Uncharacterized protein n=1 Tax=Dipteronia dyeriana TaxID=168575 RepID=A0AAD9TGU7_9ROSI|nr:hypothetical protein Ddye_030303 [Dipteronia dyeriana]
MGAKIRDQVGGRGKHRKRCLTESDTAEVVKSITSSKTPRSDLGLLVKDIRDTMSLVVVLSVTFVRSGANDWLML